MISEQQSSDDSEEEEEEVIPTQQSSDESEEEVEIKVKKKSEQFIRIPHVRLPHDPVRNPSDLVQSVREKFSRNREYTKQINALCENTNNNNPNKRLRGFPNLLMMSKQHKRVNHRPILDKNGEESKSFFRWISPDKDIDKRFYGKHRDTCFDVPEDCAYISLSFSASQAKFNGGSIRVRFYKEMYKQIFSKTITLPAHLVSNCWEYQVPKTAKYYSISFRLHPIKDKIDVPKRMTLRSDTTKKRSILLAANTAIETFQNKSIS